MKKTIVDTSHVFFCKFNFVEFSEFIEFSDNIQMGKNSDFNNIQDIVF